MRKAVSARDAQLEPQIFERSYDLGERAGDRPDVRRRGPGHERTRLRAEYDSHGAAPPSR